MPNANNFNLYYWIVINIIFWTLGFAIGLIAGFIFPVIGDIIAVIVFTGSVLYFQYRILSKYYKWAFNYLKSSLYGFTLGLILGFLFTLISQNLIGLTLSHVLAFPILLVTTILFQIRVLNQYYNNTNIWIIANILSSLISIVLLFLINNYYNLRLDLLNLRQIDYSAVIPWSLIGLVMGGSYALFTGYILRNNMLILRN